MTPSLAGQETVVRRAAIRHSGGDPLSTRIGIAAHLRDLRLHPPALPASAILIVRRLTDPLPRTLPAGVRPASRVLSWEAAARGALDGIARRAARPAWESPGSETEAVCFADLAELLAALALDWLDHSLGSRWWWRTYFGSSSPHALWLPQWLQHTSYWVPAFLILDARCRLPDFVAALPGSVPVEFLQAAKSALSTRTAPMPRAPAGPTSGLPDSSPVRSVQEASHPRKPIPAALKRLLPEERPPTTLSQDGSPIPLLPSRKPDPPEPPQEQIAFEPPPEQSQTGAAPQAKAHEVIATRRRSTYAAPAVPVLPDSIEAAQPAPDVDWLVPRAPVPNVADIREASPSVPARADRQQPLKTRSIEEPKSDPHFEAPPAYPITGPASQSTPSAPAAPLGSPDIEPPYVSDSSPEPSQHVVETSQAPSLVPIRTQFGGLFFLLNAALHLDLYGDFSQPLRRELPISPWDLLALLAENLEVPAYASDPIHHLLAELAGRAVSSPPGAGWNPAGWNVPSKWLEPFDPDGIVRWRKRRNRYTITHAAGFALYDGPMPRRARRRLWIAHLISYLSARLTPGAAGARELLCRYVQHPARVLVTPAHVSIHFSLESHPIEIRLAGLDRDPGWIPSAGRHVTFHFD